MSNVEAAMLDPNVFIACVTLLAALAVYGKCGASNVYRTKVLLIHVVYSYPQSYSVFGSSS